MAGLLDLMNEWLIRVVVLSSFAAHVVLVLFAGIRRRKAFSWWRPFLWLAYQVADWAAIYALGNLSVGSTSREQQLVAFWAPFLLLHLGGPDNISAYSLEDNILSGRKVLEVLFQFGGASIVLYKLGGSGTLLWASVIMFAVGVAKYVERVFALWQGDLGSIQSTGKKQKQKPRSFRPDQRRGWELDDEKALLVAHDLFHISKGAFADYSDKDPHRLKRKTRRKSPPLKWRDMCKVVEMELSLMYDILYTKAAVIHTWRHGYIIRVLSPPFTAAAFLLFFFYSKDGQRRVDVVITYILLAATFLLDMRWLLRALGSTWTYAFLDARPHCWLHHAFLCTGSWHRLRRVVVSMDLGRLLLLRAPSCYRMWSGTIGQYNLLHECTRDTPTGLCSKLGKLAKCVGLEDSWNEYQYHYSRGLDISAGKVRELLFETIRQSLKKAYPVKKVYPVKEDQVCLAEEDLYGYRQLQMTEMVDEDGAGKRRRERDENLNFGPEFQEVILIWHIATDVFLLCSDQNAASPTDVKKAIKALSDYMVFIVIVRPDMLPGLKLQSMHEATRDALDKIWRNKGSSSSSRISPGSSIREKKLANILQNKGEDGRDLYRSSIILSDGTKCAKVLLKLLSTGKFKSEECHRIRKKKLRKILSHIIRKKRLRKILGELIPALKDDEEEDEDNKDEDEDEDAEEEEDEDGVAEEEDDDEDAEEEDDDEDEIPVEWDMDILLKRILKAWVRLLIFVSVRCSRDSHAKQLSRGGELTTIVWILDEHTSIFGINK